MTIRSLSAGGTQYVQFTGLANKPNPATGRPAIAVRYASYNGVQHIIVPVVALVGDSVIYPLGATCPEFVPASVLSVAPETWNQRPVLPDHPVTLGFTQAGGSANDPVILESSQFGQLFNFAFRNGALQGEMWLDPIKAAIVGRQASDIIAKCLQGAQVEVSIGAFITAIEESGMTAAGREYGVRWTSIRSDHLALGLQGKDGACDASMGCGANRSLSLSLSSLSKSGTAGVDVRKFSSTQVNLPPDISAAIVALGQSIPDDWIAESEGGREATPHVTVKYGLHDDTADNLVELLDGENIGPVSLTLGNLASFEADTYDVLYVEVTSPDLVSLNRLINDNMIVTNTQPEYNPHATIAYVAKGVTAKYVGNSSLVGMQATISEIVFSSTDESVTTIQLVDENEELTMAAASSKAKKSTVVYQRSAMSASIPSDMTDSNLRELLETAIKAKEPKASYVWVPAIYLADLRVVYSVTYADNGPSEKFERTFTIDGSTGTVTLGEIKTPVIEKTIYEPKPAALSLRQRIDSAADGFASYLRSALGVTDEESVEPELSAALIPLSEAVRSLSSALGALSALSPNTISAINASMRSAAGARHNATDQRMLQSAHSQAHDLHDQLIALGAACEMSNTEAGGAPDTLGVPVASLASKEKVLTGEKPACKCGKITVAGSENSNEGAPGDPAAATEGENTMPMTKEAAAAVTRMLAGNSPSADADMVLLKAEGVEIPAAPAKVAPEVKAAANAAAEPVKPTATATKSAEEWLAEAPESIRNLVSRSQAEEDARRKSLITSLSASQKVLSAEQLTARSTDDLITMAQLSDAWKPATPGMPGIANLAGLPMDYSGRGGPVVRQPEGVREAKPVPKPYSIALGKDILTGKPIADSEKTH